MCGTACAAAGITANAAIAKNRGIPIKRLLNISSPPVGLLRPMTPRRPARTVAIVGTQAVGIHMHRESRRRRDTEPCANPPRAATGTGGVPTYDDVDLRRDILLERPS